MIKYRYAKDKEGKLIDINSLDKTGNPVVSFFCIGCGNELIPKLGLIKIHHFAHKKIVTCSPETYLHLLGKQLFHDNFIECRTIKSPFNIELYQKRICNHYEQQLETVCNLEDAVVKFDLIQYFDKITLETKEGSFTPDVMLTSKSGKVKVFVEIAVTHSLSEKKLSSEYRIIELKIENEEDFEPIKRKLLSIKDSKVQFKNFQIKELSKSICAGNCKKFFNFFTLDIDGRVILQQQRNLKRIIHQINTDKDKLLKYLISPDRRDYPEAYKSFIANCARENLKVRNCFICRYHARNDTKEYESRKRVPPIFCKFLKKECNSNEAVTCKYFRREEQYIEELYNIYRQYNEGKWHDK